MAKKVKFPLDMADGTQIRSIEELRSHFDLTSILKYYDNGRLVEWLEARYYDAEAKKVQALDRTAPDFNMQLCAALGCEYQSDEENVSTLEQISAQNIRLDRLKQFTSDDNILSAIDSVAFTTEEMKALMEKNTPVIYLCGEKFRLGCLSDGTDTTLVGINNPALELGEADPSKEYPASDFSSVSSRTTCTGDGILTSEHSGTSCCGTDENQKQMNIHLSLEKICIDVFDLLKLEEAGIIKPNETFDLWTYLIAENVPFVQHAQYEVSKRYEAGIGVDKNHLKAFEWLTKAAESDHPEAQFRIGLMYRDGIDVTKNLEEASRWFLRGAKGGNPDAQYNIGLCYRDGIGIDRDEEQALYWLQKAADQGVKEAVKEILPLNPQNFKLSEVLLYAVGGASNLRCGTCVSADKENTLTICVGDRRIVKADVLKKLNISDFRLDENKLYSYKVRKATVKEVLKQRLIWTEYDGTICRFCPDTCEVTEEISEDFDEGIIYLSFTEMTQEAVDDFNANIIPLCVKHFLTNYMGLN